MTNMFQFHDLFQDLFPAGSTEPVPAAYVQMETVGTWGRTGAMATVSGRGDSVGGPEICRLCF